MNRTVSIIVPIYNVEKYIFECVDSLINQTYKDIEIILVDDASPDNCPQICEDYASKDERIKVIHKPNGGLSDARNAGLEIATGDYVMFVDSDDYIVDNTVEELMLMIERGGVSIASCSYSADASALTREFNEKYEVVSAKEALKSIFSEKNLNTSASMKIFATELFDGVRFPVGKIYEDYATIYKVVHKSGGVAYNGDKKYYYRPNPASITGGQFYKKQMQYFEMSDQVMSFVLKEYPEFKKHVDNRAVHMAIYFYKRISESAFDDKETIRFLARFVRKRILRYMFSGYSLSSKGYGFIISIMPKLALKVFAK